MARPPKGVWGIDIGQCALKAVRLELQDGKPTATAFDYVEHPKILSQPDADPDQLIREALEKFLSRNPIRYDEVGIAIAGQSGLARFVKLPPVEQSKIAEIVKFEAKQQIPFPLDEVVWDFQKVAGGSVTDGFAMETEIGLFAMKRDVIARYLNYFNGVKLEVHGVQMAPLALVNYATYEVLGKGGTTPAEAPDDPGAEDTPRGKRRCAVILDIGTEASNLVITDGDKIIWQRPIPLGGNNFTRALTKELKLTFAKAEHLKRNAAKSPELPAILKALKPVLQDFVGEVQRSLGYFTNTHRDAHVGYMVGVGSAFRLPGLQKYLAEKLQLDVRKPAGFARLQGDPVVNDPLFVENVLTFPVAYGVGLQMLGEARLTTNLLPPEINKDRLIRAKKPYAAAAAAALLVGTAGLALGYGASYAAVTDPGIDKGLKTAKDAATAYTGQQTKYSAKETEIKTNTEEVKAIVSGGDERVNWPRFEEVFSATLPKPGPGGNVPDAVWRADQGVEAVNWFNKRMTEGVRVEGLVADERSDYPKHLAMVNVEAVYARWADNLPAFLAAADAAAYGDPNKGGRAWNITKWMKADEQEPDGERDRKKPKIAEGTYGWVVEVRGYTEHTRGENLIVDTLIKNLQRTDEFIDKVGGPDKVKKYVPGVEDPVKGKVSHAFIFQVWPDVNPAPNSFKHINRSYLDRLINPAGQARGGGGGVNMMPGSDPASMMSGGGGDVMAPTSAGPAWTPLIPSGSAGGGRAAMQQPGGEGYGPSGYSPDMAGPGGDPDMRGGGPEGGRRPPAGGNLGAPSAMTGQSGSGTPVPSPTTPGTGAGAYTVPEALTVAPRQRFEFVVMFVWREPVLPQTPTQ